MKKTLLTFSVLAALACCTLAFAAYGEGSGKKEAHAAPAAKISENNANYGVSIGTVEAQLYSESGLYLDYFEYADYVAKTSDGTYMGFKSYSELLNDEETNEKNSQSYVSLVAIYSEEAAITIPDSIKVGEKNYPVKRIDSYWELYRGFNERIKKLTIPSPITYIYNDYDFDRYWIAFTCLEVLQELTIIPLEWQKFMFVMKKITVDILITAVTLTREFFLMDGILNKLL